MLSGVVRNISAILFIFSCLLSPSLFGTIPTEDAFPFVASFTPFLSIILPLIALLLDTFTLSVSFKFGKIKFEDQLILYVFSFFVKTAVLSKLISPPEVFILVVYWTFALLVPSLLIPFTVICIFAISIPEYIFLFLLMKSSSEILDLLSSSSIWYISSYFSSLIFATYSSKYCAGLLEK